MDSKRLIWMGVIEQIQKRSLEQLVGLFLGPIVANFHRLRQHRHGYFTPTSV
jgi:hypothetical protein